MAESDADPDRSQRRSQPERPPQSEIHAFLGAGLVVAALLLPHARLLPVASGIALAGALRWGWLRIRQ